jgi:uncharacterized protein YllA (UPF0747 family)
VIRTDWLTQLAPALNVSGAAKERLERAGNGKSFIVTTGQQPGLFGGPLYTLYKALSALAVADELERKEGVPVAPIFWAATDDSDFEEARSIYVASNGASEKIDIPPAGAVGTVLSEMPLGDITPQIEQLKKLCSPVTNEVPIQLVEKTHNRGATIGSAYVELLRGILEPLGIAVLDSSHKAVRSAAFPVLSEALTRADDIAGALRVKNEEIEASGGIVQVPEVKGLSLVFNRHDNRRRRVPIKGARKVLRDALPGDLSWNVLLRPVIERQILPTRLYVAGPSEMAYFEQAQTVAKTMNVDVPMAVPRWSDGTPEERTHSYIPFMTREGLDYVERLMSHIRVHASAIANS